MHASLHLLLLMLEGALVFLCLLAQVLVVRLELVVLIHLAHARACVCKIEQDV